METKSIFSKTSTILLIGLCVFFFGCSPKESKPPERPPWSETPPQTLWDGPKNPEKTVDEFLAAMLHGDEKQVDALLTPLARKKRDENKIPFSFSASSTASFHVDHTVRKGEIGAYVHTTLTDQGDDGQKESAEIVWIVAKTDEGWRVAGAAVALLEGEDKTIINFEEPEAAQKLIAGAAARETRRQ